MTEMTDASDKTPFWDWGMADNAEVPHIFIMRGDEKFLTITPCDYATGEKVDELVCILLASGYR